MLPSLSDNTKKFIAVSAVLAVAVCNVVFGIDWVNEPGARRTAATAGAIDAPILAAPPAEAPGLPLPAPNAAAQVNAPAADAAQPKCDVTACAAAYRSFRASDCTFNPSIGPRQLCTKGVAPSVAVTAPASPPAPDAQPTIMQEEPIKQTNAQPAAPPTAKCNVSACAAAYRSFRESDCTFNPSIGPRQICVK
jgi:hypothetical protein